MVKAQVDTILILSTFGMILALSLVVVFQAFHSMPSDGAIGEGREKFLLLLRIVDVLYLLIIVGIIYLGVYSARNQDVMKGFLPISILLLCILIPLGGTLSDVFFKLVSRPEFAEVRNYMPILYFCQRNWTTLITGVGFAILYANYGKEGY